ncbi:MAG TPA: hypothetical protein VFS20_09455 [Longimicrobium sp.]|nr:hypothetical protein [Longimicrobium sp.]
MKSFTRPAVAAAALVAAFGCTPAVNPAPVAARGSCAAEVPSADVSRWQSVSAEGFTFCVPPDWSATGRTTWSRGTARVTWGVGQTVADADIPSMVSAANRPAPACVGSASKGVQIHRTAEVIGGREAQVWRNRYRQGFYTGAHWTTPHIYIVGEASDAATADLEMVILRTARVASR